MDENEYFHAQLSAAYYKFWAEFQEPTRLAVSNFLDKKFDSVLSSFRNDIAKETVLQRRNDYPDQALLFWNQQCSYTIHSPHWFIWIHESVYPTLSQDIAALLTP